MGSARTPRRSTATSRSRPTSSDQISTACPDRSGRLQCRSTANQNGVIMNSLRILMLAAASSFALTCSAAAAESYAPAPLPVASEPAPRLHVDEPLPEALARGLAVIRYRTENLRIVPVFGPGALDVSPRVGHLHVSVDGSPWHWADASGVPLIIQGLPVGPHKVLVQIADPPTRCSRARPSNSSFRCRTRRTTEPPASYRGFQRS